MSEPDASSHPSRGRRALDPPAAVLPAEAGGFRGHPGRERPRGGQADRGRGHRPARVRHPDARHERRRGAARREGLRPRHPRHHHHRLRVQGDVGGGAPPRSVELRREGRPRVPGRRGRGRPEGPRATPAAPGAPAAAAGEPPPQAHPRHVAPVLEHHRPQRADGRGVPPDRDRRLDDEHDPRDRRVGHREGAGGPRHPLQLAAPRPPVRGAQLRGAARDSFSSRSCSATCAGPSPAPRPTRRV